MLWGESLLTWLKLRASPGSLLVSAPESADLQRIWEPSLQHIHNIPSRFTFKSQSTRLPSSCTAHPASVTRYHSMISKFRIAQPGGLPGALHALLAAPWACACARACYAALVVSGSRKERLRGGTTSKKPKARHNPQSALWLEPSLYGSRKHTEKEKKRKQSLRIWAWDLSGVFI